MEPEEADDIRRLLRYDDFSAGGMMTSEPIVLAPDETVADALARIRNADLSPALASQVYVCRQPTETPTGKYLGVCPLPKTLAGAAIFFGIGIIGHIFCADAPGHPTICLDA